MFRRLVSGHSLRYAEISDRVVDLQPLQVIAAYALQIAQSLLLSGAGLTSRLNRLESQNLLARLPEPNDRRTLRVQLTAAGEAVINDAIPRVFEAQRTRLFPLGSESQKRLVEELTKFAEVIDNWSSGPPV